MIDDWWLMMTTFDSACSFPHGSYHNDVIPQCLLAQLQTATIEDLSLATDVQPLEKALGLKMKVSGLEGMIKS